MFAAAVLRAVWQPASGDVSTTIICDSEYPREPPDVVFELILAFAVSTCPSVNDDGESVGIVIAYGPAGAAGLNPAAQQAGRRR